MLGLSVLSFWISKSAFFLLKSLRGMKWEWIEMKTIRTLVWILSNSIKYFSHVYSFYTVCAFVQANSIWYVKSNIRLARGNALSDSLRTFFFISERCGSSLKCRIRCGVLNNWQFSLNIKDVPRVHQHIQAKSAATWNVIHMKILWKI